MQGLALVDYDNVGGHENRLTSDFELHAVDLMDRLANAFNTVFPGLDGLDVRLYGGWVDEFGGPSESAVKLYPVLPSLRGRRSGLIIRPTLATAMLEFPTIHLRGTMRKLAKRRRQKMVDGMLGCDAIFAASRGAPCVGVVSDDDDLLPATLTACASSRGHTVWMRGRAVGEGFNDRDLQRSGLRIHGFEDRDHA